MPPTIAIVGRPNVGKSTLFNRLTGKRAALVSDVPGLTRDRREGEARIGGHAVRLIDTAGLEEAAPGSIAARMRAQSEAAIGRAIEASNSSASGVSRTREWALSRLRTIRANGFSLRYLRSRNAVTADAFMASHAR